MARAIMIDPMCELSLVRLIQAFWCISTPLPDWLMFHVRKFAHTPQAQIPWAMNTQAKRMSLVYAEFKEYLKTQGLKDLMP